MEQYFFKNRDESLNGICFKKEQIITGIIFNPVDYVLDGLKFINSARIESMIVEDDNFKEKVLKQKAQKYFDESSKKIFKNHPIHNFQELFRMIHSLELLCEMSLSEEDVIYIGKVVEVYDDSIDIDFFDTECKLLDNAYVEYEDITCVTIFSDYVDTLCEVIKNPEMY